MKMKMKMNMNMEIEFKAAITSSSSTARRQHARHVHLGWCGLDLFYECDLPPGFDCRFCFLAPSAAGDASALVAVPTI